MSEISIRRQHGKSLAEARASADHMAAELSEEFDLSYAWNGDVMTFKRPGVNGELSVDEREVDARPPPGLSPSSRSSPPSNARSTAFSMRTSRSDHACKLLDQGCTASGVPDRPG
jgi:putative polyhydroxyalkanoate system protein